jgi:hypothetical protein
LILAGKTMSSKEDDFRTEEEIVEAAANFLKEILDIAIEYGCPPQDGTSIHIRLYGEGGDYRGSIETETDFKDEYEQAVDLGYLH